MLSELRRRNDFTELSACSSDLKMTEEKIAERLHQQGLWNSSKSFPLLHEKLVWGESYCSDSRRGAWPESVALCVLFNGTAILPASASA